jgi:FKBP-type peptidyl-prolyl cis-trans isomerase (trigger factor)
MDADIKINRKENSEIEISGKIEPKVYNVFRPRVLKRLGSEIEMPGFRKGHIPNDILVQKLGEQRIMEEIANLALSDIYPRIVEREKLDVVGQPRVSITKLASGNPIEFTIQTAVLPEAKLPDYMSLASEYEPKEASTDVSEGEVDEVINRIRRDRAKAAKQTLNPDTKLKDEDIKEEDIPALTDEFVKSLGEFSNVDDFRITLTANIKRDKEIRVRDKRRAEILDSIVSKTDLALPQVIVETELSKMLAGFKENVSRLNLSFDDYLKQIGKTEEELRTSWQADAEKRAKTQIVLNEIAKREKIRPKKENTDKEVAHVLQHNPKADQKSVEVYVTSVLANHMVLELLESKRGKRVDTN